MINIYDNAVPENWLEDELRHATIRKRGYSWTKEDETVIEESSTVPVIRIPNIQEKLDLANLLHLRNVSPDAVRASAVSRGWILFVGSNGNPDRIGDSVLMTEDRPMVFASFLMGIASKNPERIAPEFLAAWLRLHNVHEAFSKTSQQTTGLANFSWSAVKRLPLRFPSDIGEQKTITSLLQRVDDAISAAGTKLTAARRLKTALMQQLFTRGIPGRHSRFKQTNIGEIPEEWEVTRISNIISEHIYNGISPQSRPDPPGTPILNVSCISAGLCDPNKVTYVDFKDTHSNELLAKRGDFFVLRGNGNRDYIATGGVLKKDPPPGCVFSDLLFKIQFDTGKVVEGFMPLFWQSSSFIRRLQSKAVSGSGLWKIGLREIRRHELAMPLKEEQEEIVDLLYSTDESIDCCEKEIHALQRLKRSLLQNLLTGKVRVKPLETLP
jgi:type I restriction enzyme, S subunit